MDQEGGMQYMDQIESACKVRWTLSPNTPRFALALHDCLEVDVNPGFLCQLHGLDQPEAGVCVWGPVADGWSIHNPIHLHAL